MILLPWKDVSHAFTGYCSDVVVELSISLKSPTLDVFCALAMLHLNLTHEKAAAVLIPYVGGHYSAPHIWKKIIQPALKLSDEAGNLADTEKIFYPRKSILHGVKYTGRRPHVQPWAQ